MNNSTINSESGKNNFSYVNQFPSADVVADPLLDALILVISFPDFGECVKIDAPLALI